MLELIIAVKYRNLISIYSGCHNFSAGSYARLCIINVSRDCKVKNMLEINTTVQKIVETIKFFGTNVKAKL